MKYSSFIFVLLLFTFSITSYAQTRTLDALVNDSADHPIAGATVILRNKKTKAERTETTGAEGRVSFQNIEDADAYEIVVVTTGFARVIRDLNAAESHLTVVLEPRALEEQVTVTATRTEISTNDAAVSVSVLDREAIDRLQVNTIGDIFRTLPGTSTTNEGAFQVRPRIRGLDSNRVLVLVDGERLNNGRTSTGQSGIE